MQVLALWSLGLVLTRSCALTAVSVAALTMYDMCKSIDRGMRIGPIGLVEKSGGKSGHFQRELQHDSHEG